jgi:hypothetical protein
MNFPLEFRQSLILLSARYLPNFNPVTATVKSSRIWHTCLGGILTQEHVLRQTFAHDMERVRTFGSHGLHIPRMNDWEWRRAEMGHTVPERAVSRDIVTREFAVSKTPAASRDWLSAALRIEIGKNLCGGAVLFLRSRQ